MKVKRLERVGNIQRIGDSTLNIEEKSVIESINSIKSVMKLRSAVNF
jgi:hypothetical protein